MKWIFAVILIFIIYVSLPRYNFQQLSDASIEFKAEDQRINQVEDFFVKTNSPFKKYAKDFIEVADKYQMDWKLLPVISMVESTGGKNYILNGFGWGSDRIDFGSDVDDIDGVAGKINSLSYYQKYKKTGLLRDFAMAYNYPYWEKYQSKLIYFYEKF
jgi:hypothetical protein